METQKSFGAFDRMKLLAAFLVVAIHTSPLESFSGDWDFFLTRVFARLAVPFFFMVTGQFVLSRNEKIPWTYIRKILGLYGISILLYIPIGIYAGHYKGLTAGRALQMLLFEGTFYHLWYFPALILGIFVTGLLLKLCSRKVALTVALLLYFLGLLGDSYWGLAKNIPGAAFIYEGIFSVFGYTRNGLFFAPLFLLMGAGLGGEFPGEQKREKQKSTDAEIRLGIGLTAAFLAMTAEAFVLRYFELQRHDSMYLALPVCMFFLYRLLLNCPARPFSGLRQISAWVYILHPAVLVAVRALGKAVPAAKALLENSLAVYLLVCMGSGLAALAIGLLSRCFRKKEACKGACERSAMEQRFTGTKTSSPMGRSRAWIEIDRAALAHNVSKLQALLPGECRLMPAVKADAYGHGAVLIAKELNRLGIYDFCVACIQEGIELRKAGIQGEILILGYTHPSLLPLLHQWRLTQTVVDYEYAAVLNQFGKPIKVHIGIDTGMHRLGERSEHRKRLLQMVQMEHLNVVGAFTHLCTDDRDTRTDRAYTIKQAEAFYGVLEEWENCGFVCPKVHLLASYGVLNYPEFAGDYARVGIALYGVRSTRTDYDRFSVPLRPVLSLKARVASVKELSAGEGAGYGLAFVAKGPTRIAVLAIGYGDGLPRALGNGTGLVLLRGRKAAILGRICMDQTLVDVTEIPDVRAGDTAVLIGRSKGAELTAYEMAEAAGTITNEILSRMGSRLERILL